MDQKPRIDPGWNDPPMLNYSAINPPPKSRITNRRVAFPLNNNSPIVKSPVLSSSLSPSIPPPLVYSLSETRFPQSLATKNNICEFLESEEARKHFSNIWEGGKFSEECRMDIELLAGALIEQDKISAGKIKEKLILQNKDTCEQWLREIKL